jgi:hypothetical protein
VYECRDRAQFRIWRDRLPGHFDRDGEPIVCPPGMGYEFTVCGTHRKRWGDWEHVIGVERLPSAPR